MVLSPEILELIALHNFFAETKYGQTLAGNIRYGRYKPAHWSNEKWEQVLGPDVNNLKHLLHVLLSTKKFLETEKKFSTKDRFLLSLAAITHDWGEGIVGDIISDLKTDEQEKREIIAFREVASGVLSVYKKEEYLAALGSIKPIIFGGCRLHFVFKSIIEKLIEENTALRAWREAKKHPAEALNLQWISANVFVYIPNLLDNAALFPLIQKFFAANWKSITEIFAAMPVPVFEHYNYDLKEKAQKIEMFEKAKNLWLKTKYVN